MKRYWLGSVLDHVLLQDLKSLVARDRATTAELLAHLAEVEERGLYREAACESMHRYCVRVLRMSDDIAFKRLAVARSAREFPILFEMIADGRLNLSSALMLKPHLTATNALELFVAAANQTNAQVAQMLAERFPQPDVEYRLELSAPAQTAVATEELAVRRVAPSEVLAASETQVPLSTTGMPSAPPPARPRVAPLSADRCSLQATIRRSTHDKLRYAEGLLGRAVPFGDFDAVLERALDALIHELEKRKFGKGSRPRHSAKRASKNPRYVPMHVRREVMERDGGRCTFTSDDGHRCEATAALEFDHEIPVARGGQSTTENVRLRCRAHNQLAAEQAFGAGTLREKRDAARAGAEQARARKIAETTGSHAWSMAVTPRTESAPTLAAAAPATATPRKHVAEAPIAPPPAPEHVLVPDHEVLPWLRQRWFGAAEARRGAELCAHMTGAPLEARVHFAIASLAPRSARPVASPARSPG